jgi:hypothetical protein
VAIKAAQNLTRDTLRKLQSSKHISSVAKQLAQLRLQYSEDAKLLTGYINKLVNINRIYPRHLPTQASFRWSTFDPPITNWPRACINTNCIRGEHEWTDVCWSVRDILLADSDEVLITWDHDNIEGRIHDIIVDDREAIEAHKQGFDLHTITCCSIFGYDMPQDLRNPHQSEVDTSWRSKYNWQGKDTKQRVLAKNFNHGSKYTDTWRFVYTIPAIEQYGVSRQHLADLAKRYIASKGDAWATKLAIMKHIQLTKVARTLYGGRRQFYDSSKKTGHEGFSHMISGTVSDYNNITLIMLEDMLGDSIRIVQNAHDGDKICIKKDNVPTINELRQVIEREISYQGRSILLTAGIKVIA